MWIWREDREDTAGGAFDRDGRTRGRWYLDPHGAWTWSETAAGSDVRSMSRAGASSLAVLPAPAAPGDSRVGPGPWVDETPIFHAVSDDHSRRSRLHPIEGEASGARIPEPSPGSGPIPIQDGSNRPRTRSTPTGGHLTSVPTVPPPPGPRDEVVADSASPEDELRRRAERRRRPQAAETARGSGRHAMRSEQPRTGRHALEV